MASPGELVKIVAISLGLPEPTVVVHDRNLVIAGLRSKGGRGRSAAAVTARDAANLLTAVLGSGLVKDSVASVERYAETRPQRATSSETLYSTIGLKDLSGLPASHSFVDGLEALIASAANGSLAGWLANQAKGTRARKIDVAPQIEVSALTPGTLGNIRISGINAMTADVRYALPDPWAKRRSKPPPKKEIDAWEARSRQYGVETDLEQYRRISAKTILGIAEALMDEKDKES
jgi:hypothetical protein